MDSLVGGIKTTIGTKPDLVSLYKHCTVFSGTLAMATDHAMLINLHLSTI
jgi:hypothetical protein